MVLAISVNILFINKVENSDSLIIAVFFMISSILLFKIFSGLYIYYTLRKIENTTLILKVYNIFLTVSFFIPIINLVGPYIYYKRMTKTTDYEKTHKYLMQLFVFLYVLKNFINLIDKVFMNTNISSNITLSRMSTAFTGGIILLAVLIINKQYSSELKHE